MSLLLFFNGGTSAPELPRAGWASDNNPGVVLGLNRARRRAAFLAAVSGVTMVSGPPAPAADVGAFQGRFDGPVAVRALLYQSKAEGFQPPAAPASTDVLGWQISWSPPVTRPTLRTLTDTVDSFPVNSTATPTEYWFPGWQPAARAPQRAPLVDPPDSLPAPAAPAATDVLGWESSWDAPTRRPALRALSETVASFPVNTTATPTDLWFQGWDAPRRQLRTPVVDAAYALAPSEPPSIRWLVEWPRAAQRSALRAFSDVVGSLPVNATATPVEYWLQGWGLPPQRGRLALSDAVAGYPPPAQAVVTDSVAWQSDWPAPRPKTQVGDIAVAFVALPPTGVTIAWQQDWLLPARARRQPVVEPLFGQPNADVAAPVAPLGWQHAWPVALTRSRPAPAVDVEFVAPTTAAVVAEPRIGGRSPWGRRPSGGRHQALDTEAKWRAFLKLDQTGDTIEVPPAAPETIQPAPPVWSPFARQALQELSDQAERALLIDRQRFRAQALRRVQEQQWLDALEAEAQRLADEEDEEEIEFLLLHS